MIEIDGSSAGTNVNVFQFATGSDDSQIRGLVIGNFSDLSVILMQASNVVVRGNYIGTNPAGTIAKPNAGVGLNHSGSGTGDSVFIRIRRHSHKS